MLQKKKTQAEPIGLQRKGKEKGQKKRKNCGITKSQEESMTDIKG